MTSGIETAIIANTLYISGLTLLLRRRHNTPAHRILFNIATAAINVYLYGSIYSALGDVEKYVLPVLGIAFTFFLSNSLFIATAIALTANEHFFSIWKNYSKLALDFLLSGCAAAIIAHFIPLLFPNSSMARSAGPVLLAPFIGAVYMINKVNRSKALAAEQHLADQESLYFRTVGTLALAVDAKDQTTYGHIRRVRAYAMGLSKLCDITDANELKAIEYGSLLHDIGKLAIEDYILNKPGRLNPQEFEKMKLHSTAGDEILQQVEFPFPVAKYVRYHHERWDGKGYPDGLKGTEIPLGARILSVADAFDAIRSTRPYKSSFGIHDSIELLRSQSGLSYDPMLVNLFIDHIEELEAAADEASNNISELSFRKYYNNAPPPIDPSLSRPDALSTCSSLEQLVAIFELCANVAKILPLVDSLTIIARRIKLLIPHDLCAFYICQNDDSVKLDYCCGLLSELVRENRLNLGKAISGWVAAYKRPMLNTNPGPDFEGLSKDLRIFNDTMVVPILFEEECLGTISLYSIHSSFFTTTNVALLQLIANQLSSLFGIHNRADATQSSNIDPVTQTHRISYLSLAGSHILANSALSQSPLSLVSLEIRNFSHYLSLYGASVADLILRDVSNILRSELRETDILVRFGTSGFIALLPGVSNSQAIRYMYRLIQQIRSKSISVSPSHSLSISCFFGIASYPNDGSTLFDLMNAAHKFLRDQSNLSNGQLSGPEGNVLEFPPRS
jgi:diguanylate cyclase (GGDEF)-like protein